MTKYEIILELFAHTNVI